MKRFIAAVSFAVIAVPAFAGLPYEQTELDRALPNVAERPADPQVSRFGAPYDQTAVDRALPDIRTRDRVVAAFSGDTRSDVEIATDAREESPWADDHNFIAPAQ